MLHKISSYKSKRYLPELGYKTYSNKLPSNGAPPHPKSKYIYRRVIVHIFFKMNRIKMVQPPSIWDQNGHRFIPIMDPPPIFLQSNPNSRITIYVQSRISKFFFSIRFFFSFFHIIFPALQSECQITTFIMWFVKKKIGLLKSALA